jgi:hypothetical protein
LARPDPAINYTGKPVIPERLDGPAPIFFPFLIRFHNPLPLRAVAHESTVPGAIDYISEKNHRLRIDPRKDNLMAIFSE